MEQRKWLAGVVVIGLGLGLYFWRQGGTQAPQQDVGAESNSQIQGAASTGEEGVAQSPAGSPAVAASPGQESGSSDIHPADAPRLVFPTLEVVREEVKANPHATPPSLIRFAKELAPQMEEALRTPEPKVVKRMTFALKACALSTSQNALPQVQALCVSNWKRLVEARAKEVPGIEDELRQSESRIPAEARRLIEAAQAIVKPVGE